MPAPPIPTKCSLRRRQGSGSVIAGERIGAEPTARAGPVTSGRAPRRAASSTSPAISRAASGRAIACRGARHRGQPRAVAEQTTRLRGQPRPGQVGVRRSRPPRPPVPCGARCRPGGRPPSTGTGSGSSGGRGRRSRTPSRRSGRSPGRPPAAPRRSCRCSRAGRNAGPGAVRSARSRVPAACRIRTRPPAPANASIAAWLIERAPCEPPNTSTHWLIGLQAEPPAGGGAVGRGRRHRPAGDRGSGRSHGRRSRTPGRRVWPSAPASGW